MPYTWDLTDTPDFDALDPDVTHAILMVALPLQIDQITQENAAEVYAAIKVYEGLFGALLRGRENDDDPWTDMPITAHMVRDRIGMRTNSFGKTPAQNVRRLVTQRLKDHAAEYRREANG